MLTYWTGVFIFGGGGGGGCKEELEIVDLILLFLRWFIDPLVQVKTAAHGRERERCVRRVQYWRLEENLGEQLKAFRARYVLCSFVNHVILAA